jgi:hypothetical protein
VSSIAASEKHTTDWDKVFELGCTGGGYIRNGISGTEALEKDEDIDILTNTSYSIAQERRTVQERSKLFSAGMICEQMS